MSVTVSPGSTSVGSSNERTAGFSFEWYPWFQATYIHLFPAFFKASELARGAIVLHEATHKYVGTEDHAYLHEDRYAELSVADALNNADSYAMLCAEGHGAEQDREGEERETERIAKEKADLELATVHIGEIWARYERGDLTLWKDDHTLADGAALSAYVVTLAMLDWYETEKRQNVVEVYAAYEGGQEEGPLECCDGTTVRRDLYEALIERR